LEQEVYTREGIDWTKIEFNDNHACLDLINRKPTGAAVEGWLSAASRIAAGANDLVQFPFPGLFHLLNDEAAFARCVMAAQATGSRNSAWNMPGHAALWQGLG
jgi:hypothetical protein